VTNDPVVTGAVRGSLPAVTPGAAPARAAELQRVKQLAQEFEAMIMTQMLRGMRRSMLSEEDREQGLGNESMIDTIDIELGRALSRAGGFGLADVLAKAIEARHGSGTQKTSDQPAVNVRPIQVAPIPIGPPSDVPRDAQPIVAPSEPPRRVQEPMAPRSAAPDLQVPEGRQSSAFGWRRDPFTGVRQFHRGIDVAQAYGQDVRAAAAGRVTYAGDRGAYGTMIVIDHPEGRQTRYAHLSLTGVKPGDLVDIGQIIGKSGDSGRSTGPHLHFEVLEAGRVVDPRTTS
jgi:murein DD-endopeptidase MepM/ murein hydrolase activator NlpD